MREWISAVVILISVPAFAGTPDIKAIVENHVLPGYRIFATEAAGLAAAASSDCSPTNPGLWAAFHDAFDAWIGVSHLRFGPSETQDRAFALAFWPDPRGSTPKALATLIRNRDPVVKSPEGFATVSIAARGFHALEFLLYDEGFSDDEHADYRCMLIRAVSRDISANAVAILGDWERDYGELITNPGNDSYRTETEAAQRFFTSLSTGLEFTADTRLGRPMGTFDRPRPNRAEAHRSRRSLRHVVLSLEASRDLASLLTGGDTSVDRAFDRVIGRAGAIDDPVFAGVSEPQGRFRVEVLRQDIGGLRRLLAEDVGSRLGVAAGFNSLDGD